jgi:hypothetical protein
MQTTKRPGMMRQVPSSVRAAGTTAEAGNAAVTKARASRHHGREASWLASGGNEVITTLGRPRRDL